MSLLGASRDGDLVLHSDRVSSIVRVVARLSVVDWASHNSRSTDVC